MLLRQPTEPQDMFILTVKWGQQVSSDGVMCRIPTLKRPSHCPWMFKILLLICPHVLQIYHVSKQHCEHPKGSTNLNQQKVATFHVHPQSQSDLPFSLTLPVNDRCSYITTAIIIIAQIKQGSWWVLLLLSDLSYITWELKGEPYCESPWFSG